MMSHARLAFCVVVCLASVAWAVLALFEQSVHINHRELVAAVRSGAKLPLRPTLTDAVARETRALALQPCGMALHRDRLLLLGYQSDAAMLSPDIAAADVVLTHTQAALAALLSCTPMDGKAWLDFAMLRIYREGFTPRAADAYAMSARVAPSESWLAEKRLFFALKFRPLLDAKARQVALRDLEVLKRAHPNRMSAVMKLAAVSSPEALQALFATHPPIP